MQTKLRFPVSKYRLITQAFAISLGLALLIISVAGPFAGTRKQTVTMPGHDIVILLDVSSSMTAKDMLPNRLTRAKTTITETASKLTQNRIALLAFRHKATLLCPLTYDREFLYQATKLASINSAMPGATDIGDAIISASKLFTTNSPSSKIIILFSDGEDLSDNISQALSLAEKNNITIFTVGIGQTDGTTIPDPLQPEQPYFYNGKKIITKLNEHALKKIAETSGGEYIPLYKISNIPYSNICREYLQKIDNEKNTETIKKLRHYRYNQFLLPAFLLFLFAMILGRKKKKPPHSNTTKTPLIIFVLLSATLNTSICRAEEPAIYEQKFNTAATLFSSNHYTEAITVLNSIITDNNTLPLNSAYGCTYFKLAEQNTNQLPQQIKLYKKATEAFQAALFNNPDDPIIEHNLTIAYKEMQAMAAKLKENKPASSQKPGNQQNTTEITNKNQPQQNKKQENEKHPATDSPKNQDLSNRQIDDILSTILNREKEYQMKKQKYGKIIPLNKDIQDW
jgi:Ca-activated chloride channel family protein